MKQLLKLMQIVMSCYHISGADPGFVVRGGGVSRRGVWDHLRSPVGPWQSPGRGPRGAKPPGSSGGFEELQTFI